MRRKIDVFTLTLSLVIVLFFSSIFYLYKQSENEKYFNKLHHNIESLRLLEYSFKQFFSPFIYFSNYDTITHNVKSFEHLLQTLKTPEEEQTFNEQLKRKVHFVSELFEEEKELINYKKMLNATLLNSTHYLFDLRRTLLKGSLSSKGKELINQTFFILVQNILGIHSDPKVFYKALQHLRHINQKHAIPYLDYFIIHAQKLQEDIKELAVPLKEHQELHLFKEVENIMSLLDQENQKQTQTAQQLNVILILLAILFTLLLIILHQRSKKVSKELHAFKSAVQNSDNSIVMTDKEHRITYVNDAFEKNTGYSFEEVFNQNPKILKSKLTSDEVYKNMFETLNRNKTWFGEFINKRKDGSIFYEKASISPLIINGEQEGYIGIKLDISDYKEQEQKLKLAATVFENAEEAILISDKENRIISINKAHEELFGYRLNECIGKTPHMFQSNLHTKQFYQELWEALNKKGKWVGKIQDVTKSGEVIPVWTSISVVKDAHNEVENYISLQTNLRDVIKNQEKIDFLAYHDNLTKLPNRFFFEEELNHAIKHAQREENLMAILFIDLDRFKVINDSLGHPVGDLLLQEVAERIQKELRDIDIVARIGGDEFCILLNPLSHKEDAALVSEKIITAIAKPLLLENYTLNISASIGIALYPENGDNSATLLKHADNAMYKAKANGRNSFEYYTMELSSQVHRRLELEQALQNALKNGELSVYYQPQYSLENSKLSAAEALLRWHHPELGTISPNEFIPIAEENHLIIDIGYFVFEEACKSMQFSLESSLSLDYIAVNLSTQQFRDPNLVKNFQSICERYNVEPKYIELEITERYIMEHTEQNLTILDQLHDVGFNFSIDDFGTGYSSMSYLKKLPIQTIKIDKTFIDDINQSQNDQQITKAIIALAKSLNFTTIAEGIETKEQFEALKNLGCDTAQGFLLSYPISKEAFIALLQSKH